MIKVFGALRVLSLPSRRLGWGFRGLGSVSLGRPSFLYPYKPTLDTPILPAVQRRVWGRSRSFECATARQSQWQSNSENNPDTDSFFSPGFSFLQGTFWAKQFFVIQNDIGFSFFFATIKVFVFVPSMVGGGEMGYATFR